MSIFFFNDTATTEIYTLSLHDALPILAHERSLKRQLETSEGVAAITEPTGGPSPDRMNLFSPPVPSARRFGSLRSEEHTSELQSRQYLVCRLLLEKKKINTYNITMYSF